jgi:hypothetical protein
MLSAGQDLARELLGLGDDGLQVLVVLEVLRVIL